MKRDSTRRRGAGCGPVARATVLALAGCLWAAGAQAAPWPNDDLTLEVPVEVLSYSRTVSSLVGRDKLARVPVEVRCTVYRGTSAVASGGARAEMRNETPLPSAEEITSTLGSMFPGAGGGGSSSGPPVVYYRPLREVLRVRLRNVRGVERYRCELFIDGRKRCGPGQTCEVTGEFPVRLTGPAARKAGEAVRQGVRGLGGIRGGGGFAPGR